MLQVDVSAEALLDIEQLEYDGALQFGHFQAMKYRDGLFRLFDNLAFFPMMGPELQSRHRPPLRRFPYGSHLIIYSVEPKRIVIRRVLHGRMDIERHL